MGLRKCPRCELNYIKDGETVCSVCKRAMKHEPEPEEELMCIECGEHPAMKGKELCAECYRESLRQQKLQNQRQVSLGGMEFEDVGDVTGVSLPDEEIPTGSISGGMDDEFEDEKPKEQEEGEIEFSTGPSIEVMSEEENEPDEFDDYGDGDDDGMTPARKKHRG